MRKLEVSLADADMDKTMDRLKKRDDFPPMNTREELGL